MAAFLRSALPAFCCICLATGCSIGPSVIRCNMVRYNESVVDTENEQFLLNLVRIRYRETPKTLGVSQVTSQYSSNQTVPMTGTLTHFSHILSTGSSLTTAALPTATVGSGLTASLVDVPTITFIPESGADFNRGLLTPLGLDRVIVLANTGWDLEMVLRLVIQNLNRVENMPHVVGQPSHRPVRLSSDFNQVAAALGELHHASKLLVVPDPQPVLAGVVGELPAKEKAEPGNEDKKPEVKGADLISAADKHYRFTRETDPTDKKKHVILLRTTFDSFLLKIDNDAYPNNPELRRALDLLKVGTEPDRASRLRMTSYRFMPGDKVPFMPEDNDIYVGTRNIIGCAVFVSKGIDIPEAHYAQGLVETPVDEFGQPFNWTKATEGLFHVCVEKHRPKNAYVAAQHRGYWYYIPDDDLTTKATFNLLKEMFDVQIAPGLSTAPILTVSTSGPGGS